MKKKFTLLTLLTLISICSISFAKESKNHYKDISRHSTDHPDPRLSRSDIMDRLSVTASVYVTSADGTQLFHDVSEMRAWNLNGKENFESTWMSDSDEFGALALKQKWFLNEKNQLVASIAQYEPILPSKKGGHPKMGKLMSTKEFLITNFSPFTLDLLINGNKKTVVRFSPSLRPKDKITDDIGNFPIKGNGMVAFDNKGKVWAEGVTFTGKFVSLKTHEGSLYMSYFPFKGSTEVGLAEDGHISIRINKKHRLNLMNKTPFLPHGIKSKVFGIVKLNEKSQKLRSVTLGVSDKESEFEI